MLLRQAGQGQRVRVRWGQSNITAEVVRVSDAIVHIWSIDLGSPLSLPGDTECEPLLAEGSEQGDRRHPGRGELHDGATAPHAPQAATHPAMAPTPAPAAEVAPSGEVWTAATHARSLQIHALVAKTAEGLVGWLRQRGAPDAPHALGEAFIRIGHRLMEGA